MNESLKDRMTALAQSKAEAGRIALTDKGIDLSEVKVEKLAMDDFCGCVVGQTISQIVAVSEDYRSTMANYDAAIRRLKDEGESPTVFEFEHGFNGGLNQIADTLDIAVEEVNGDYYFEALNEVWADILTTERGE